MALRDCIDMRKNPQKASAVAWSMLVLLYYGEDGRCRGVIRNAYLDGERAFRDLGGLVLALDDLCRELEQADLQESGGDCGMPSFQELGCADDVLSVTIEHHDAGTLQGRVRGKATAGRTVCFSGALALIRILSGAGKEAAGHEP